MAVKNWENKGTCLFLRKDGRRHFDPPLSFGSVAIDRIQWINEEEAKLRLYGSLPAYIKLVKIKNGCEFEVTYKEHGEIDKYEADRVIMRFTDCQIKRRWIANLVPGCVDQFGLVMIYVTIECLLSVGNEN